MNKAKLAPILLKFYKPKVIHYLQKNRTMFFKEKQLDIFQKSRMEKLLVHAYQKTEYYKNLFDDINLVSNEGINWKRFSDIPILTKEIIRENYNDLLAKDINSRNPYKNTSGGSTGEPVIFLQDKEYYERMVADTLWFAELYGKKLGEKEIKIWGSENDIFKEKEKLLDRIINYFFNRKLLNSFRLSDKLISEYIDQINSIRPVMIWTYVDSIYEISRYVLSHGVKVFCPKIIVCTAGTMYPEMKMSIQSAFSNSKILNQYGSREVGIIGIGTDKLNIFRQSVFLELYDKFSEQYIQNSGKGNIIVTSLNNYSMPLIRFDIGDIGESDDITAGNVKMLSKLTGRENAHIYRRDGSKIHGELFTHLFYFLNDITKFQVLQENYTKFQISLEVKSGPMESEKINLLHQKINQIMEEKCDIDFRIVDEIPKLKSGKFQFVTTKVKHG